MHDPYGEADLVAGGCTCTAIGSGKGVRYSLKNWDLDGRPTAQGRAN